MIVVTPIWTAMLLTLKCYLASRFISSGIQPSFAMLTRMSSGGNDSMGSLPDVFCWTKFGTEAGELAGSIFQRKEVERNRNDGIYLWGIGNSIRPSLVDLLAATSQPQVLFSPMKSAPAKKDVAPTDLIVWHGAVGYDGRPYEIPIHSLVTSGRGETSRRSNHFALVCQRRIPLRFSDVEHPSISMSEVRNLRSGSALGASQVTAVVYRHRGQESTGYRYPIVAQARLVYPYFVILTEGFSVPQEIQEALARPDSAGAAADELLRLREAYTRRSRHVGQLALT